MPSSQFFVSACICLHTYANIPFITVRMWHYMTIFICDFVWIKNYSYFTFKQYTCYTRQMAAQDHRCIRLSGAGALGSSPCTGPEIPTLQPHVRGYPTQPPLKETDFAFFFTYMHCMITINFKARLSKLLKENVGMVSPGDSRKVDP